MGGFPVMKNYIVTFLSILVAAFAVKVFLVKKGEKEAFDRHEALVTEVTECLDIHRKHIGSSRCVLCGKLLERS